MDPIAALLPEILEALARDATVLTANQRAARTLRHAFDLHLRACGLADWQPPAIFAWDAWLNSVWHRLLLDGHAAELLLSPTQERTLWRAIIGADANTASLRPIDALAETAASAWGLLNAYGSRRRLQAHAGNSDSRVFARWAAEFERRCARSRYLTQAELPDALRAAFYEGKLAPAPAGYLLIGFDSKTPAQIALLDAIRTAGSPIEEVAHDSPGAPTFPASSERVGRNTSEPDTLQTHSLSRSRITASDDCAELTACARWLRARLTEKPTARIAVIVPNIDADRADIDRVFRHILAPELNDIAAPTGNGPFEFSLGIALSSTPIAAAALDILRWAAGPLPLSRVSALLLSPHFAADAGESANEHIARAEFDAFVLRDKSLLQPQASLENLYGIASHSRRASSLPIFLRSLRALRSLLSKRDHSVTRTHTEWAAIIHEILEAAGWAPEGSLDSTEFQTRHKWETALDEFATLDFDSASDGTRIAFSDALDALERIAANTLFAPESRHAPVQIMGPLESAGSSFDLIWFLRTNDREWPDTPAPNPLLPWALQRELEMPGADPARDAAHYRRITERIAASAPTVLFSHAQQTSDGPQRPSPLVAAFELCDPGHIAPVIPAEVQPYPLEDFADDAPIPPPPDRVLSGGASILQAQAECGFKAFAEKRLFASALESGSLGLDARERGSLIHGVLERFWAEVETQSVLRQMLTADRDALLARCIDAAVDKCYPHPGLGWPIAYLNAERQRLLKLLGEWLDYEAGERAPFAVRSREEVLEDVSIGPLRLNIRVDRVDVAVADAASAQPSEIILDYKTGVANPADWLGDRPDQPQLPLYAVVSGAPNLAGVAFATIRPGAQVGINGYESRGGILPKATRLKAASLAAQVEEWRATLTSLAEDFYAGSAIVAPKHYPNTCRYCEQRMLCRLDLSTLNADALEDIDPDDDVDSPDFFDSTGEAGRE